MENILTIILKKIILQEECLVLGEKKDIDVSRKFLIRKRRL